MSKRFAIILAVLVIVFFGFLLFNKKDQASDSNSSVSNAQPSNHTYGEGKSGVVLVEYGDFQCPACYQYFPLVRQIKEEYKEQITFQFRHFPLVDIHQNALIASRAAEAAGLQGKFWEMHDLLYTNQQEWSSSTNPQPAFERYAQTIGLDIARFQTDIKSDAVNATVQADLGEAKRQDFSGTPTFVLEGKQIESPRDLDSFKKLIDEAIAAKANQQ